MPSEIPSYRVACREALGGLWYIQHNDSASEVEALSLRGTPGDSPTHNATIDNRAADTALERNGSRTHPSLLTVRLPIHSG